MKKMNKSQESFSSEDKKSLMVVHKKLLHDTQIIYKRLISVRSAHRSDDRAKALGIKKGNNLTIRNAVSGKGKSLYLSYSRE